MISFANLHFDLIALHDRKQRIERLQIYFDSLTDDRNGHWARLLLANTAQSRLVAYDELKQYAAAYTGLPLWLIEESIQHTGNITQAISLIVTSPDARENIALYEVMDTISTLNKKSYNKKSSFVQSIWEQLPPPAVHLFNKLITAGYRSPVSKNEVDQLAMPEIKTSTTLRKIKAVLLYTSQNEYTFAIWKDELLVPIAKTTTGIRPEDHMHIRKFVATNTRERFGPVYSVNPELIFEIGFESVELAARRKSGVKLISPQIIRRCHDAGLEDVDRVERLIEMVDE